VPAQNRELRHYSNTERLVDAQVHFLGIAGAVGGCAWLVSQMSGGATTGQIVAVAVYAFGLVSMPVASALYNMARPGRIKARLRQLDHIMIFVMIAGTYTPFALLAFRSPSGVLLLAAVWVLAAIGAGLKVTRLYNNEAVSVAMYLVLGWLFLPLLPALFAALPTETVLLLLLGGVVYSLGSAVNSCCRMRFHAAAWHAMVILAACLHFAAVTELLAVAG
jgi:hemolysin III